MVGTSFLGQLYDANIPTISGFGASAGYNFLIQDRSGSLTVDQLGELSREFQQAARQRPEIGNIFTSYDPLYPQVKVDLDRDKARKLGVPINEAFQAT
jgi:multidrug efflux pump subunit AcrB